MQELNDSLSKAYDKKDWSSAMDILGVIIEKRPNDTIALFSRAVANSNMKEDTDYELMISDLTKVIVIDSLAARARLLRFQTYFLQQDFNNALNDIDFLIKTRGETLTLLSNKANCAFAAKEFEVAEKYYEKILQFGGDKAVMRKYYYFWIYSKYFGDKKDSAIWDCAFMKERGLEEDEALMTLLIKDELVWDDIAQFTIPQMSIKELNEAIKSK